MIEARELCEQVLTVIRSLPPSPHRQSYERVYEAIHAALWAGVGSTAVPSPAALSTPASPIWQSHAIALEILTGSRVGKTADYSEETLLDILATRDGEAWWTGEGFEFEGDRLWTGSGETVYIFPAVRLAAVAVGATCGQRDPAAQLMFELARIRAATKEYVQECDSRFPVSTEVLERASKELQALALSAARHPRPWLMLGAVLLRLGRLGEAEEAVRQSLQRSYSAEARASALYHLACVYARSDREGDCETTLREVAILRSANTGWLVWLNEDPDFEQVRGQPWFREISVDSSG